MSHHINWQLNSLCILLLTAFFAVSSAQAEVSATVDRTQISEDETVRLTVVTEDRGFKGQPDTNQLMRDFDILNQKSSSQTQIINGKISSSRSWNFLLSPKRNGRLLIPSFTLGSEKTQAIPIFVSKAAAPTYSGKEELFVESAISKREVYVQEELVYVFRLYTAVGLGSASLEPLVVENALVEEPKDSQYNKQVNGRFYQVIEKRYIIHPQESGEIVIPPLTLSARVQDGRRSLFDDGRLVRKRSDEHTIAVKPPNPAFAGSVWLPAKNLQLTDTFSDDPDKVSVGNSLTRSITITAEGLLAAQLPPIDMPTVAGLKIYSDKASIENREVGSELVGQRVESMAIIPTRAGTYTLPAVTIGWWNTETDEMEWSTIPEREIKAIADANAVTPPAEQPLSSELPTEQLIPEITTTEAQPTTELNALPSKSLLLWQIATAAFALLWLLTLFAWVKAKSKEPSSKPAQKSPAATSETKAYAELKAAINKKDAGQTRNSLISWAGIFWEDEKIKSLSQVGYKMPTLSDELLRLDASVFRAPDTQLDYADILSAVDKHRASKQGSNKSKHQLGELYPQ